MKYVFVGDIHGKADIVKLALDKDGHKVFVGDFLDSFDRPLSDHEKCLELVIAAAKAGEADVLFGNHELSYLMPTQHRCSGYSARTEHMLIPHKADMWKYFKTYLPIGEEWLVTHAGMHPTVQAALKKPIYEEFLEESSPVHWIGRSRGGRNPVGGIFWCDFNEEFVPIPGLNQIFGHSRHKTTDIRYLKGDNSHNYCIDCLDSKISFLELEI